MWPLFPTLLVTVQLVVGSYIEPRLSGSALAMSPFVVLCSIFLWTFLWDLPGTFMGAPIAVAPVTFCAKEPSTCWLALLLEPPNQADGPDRVADDHRRGSTQP
ncbi:AI-2E family transporter [Microvirga sp. P5_D2]